MVCDRLREQIREYFGSEKNSGNIISGTGRIFKEF
jgi:hypothetical protein